jgi:hypothetical protein
MLRGTGRFMRNYIYIKNEVGRIRDVQNISVQVCGAPLADAADVARHRALHAEL